MRKLYKHRKAIIDVGSNSIKLLICDISPDNTVQSILDENEVTRLGQGLRETGQISPEAMARGSRDIANFAKKARDMAADEIICVGTMALRNAKNSGEFVQLVNETCGIDIKIISGEEEARLAHMAALSGLSLQGGNYAIFDIGGGSTEFIFGQNNQATNSCSINLGSLLLTEKYFKHDPVRQADIDAAMAEISSMISPVTGGTTQLVGIGGNVITMGAVKHKIEYTPSVIHGSTLTLADVEEQIETYRLRNLEERRKITGLAPQRADIILAGAYIVKAIIQHLGVDSLTISVRGLRYGVAYGNIGTFA